VIERRAFIGAMTGGLLAASLAAEAPPAVSRPRIGYLHPNVAASPHPLEAFRQGLRDLRYVEGRTVVAELVAPSGTLAALAAKQRADQVIE
jgi:hypothetical protein